MKNLESKRVCLRRLQPSDFENMRILETNPLIVKVTPFRIPQSEEQTRARLADQIAKQVEREPFGIWAAELKDDQAFVGWFTLMPREDEVLELGYMLVQSQWGKGLATEIGGTLINFARTEPTAKNLIAKTRLDNFASIRILEKLGFKYRENITAPEKVLGGEIELKIFSLLVG